MPFLKTILTQAQMNWIHLMKKVSKKLNITQVVFPNANKQIPTISKHLLLTAQNSCPFSKKSPVMKQHTYQQNTASSKIMKRLFWGFRKNH